MIGRLLSVVDDVLLRLDELATVVYPRVKTISAGNLGTTRNETLGLFVKVAGDFPDALKVTVRGHVVIGKNLADPRDPSRLRVALTFGLAENPALAGLVNMNTAVQLDGTYEVSAALFFRPTNQIARPFRLHGMVRIEGADAAVKVKASPVRLENAHLQWFLDVLEQEEQRAALKDRLQFVASVRKVFLNDPTFDYAIGRAKKVRPLHDPETSPVAARWRAADTTWLKPEYLRLSHVLIGIEGGRKQAPQPNLPGKLDIVAGVVLEPIGDLVTWAGDLGSALQEFLFQHNYPQYFKKMPDFPTYQEYIDKLVSPDQLIADIDGVNLADRYNSRLSLADNLRDYYNHDSQKRFSLYLATQQTQDGQAALSLQKGAPRSTLTAKSHQFLSQTICSVTNLLLSAAIFLEQKKQRRFAIEPAPDPVAAALRPNSLEVQKLVQHFVQFLEDGLSKE